MTKLSLSKLVDERGQAAVAKLFNISAPAIHKAVEANRNITVTIKKDGSVEAKEICPFPRQQKKDY